MMPRRLLFTLSILFTLSLFIILEIVPVSFYENKGIDQRTIRAIGTIYEKQKKEDKSIIYLKNVSLDTSVYNKKSKNKEKQESISGLMVYLEEDSMPPIGSKVEVEGKAKCLERRRNPGQFDQAFYYKLQGIDLIIFEGKVQRQSKKYNVYLEGLYRVRSYFINVFGRILPEKEGGVMQAMILGDKGQLSQELKSLYQRNGISHILAISGLHISLIGAGIYYLLRKIGLSYHLCAFFGASLMVSYGIMTGGGASTMRAVIMFLLQIYANALGRTYDMLTALAVAGICLLVQNPLYLYHPGFLLSFGAVLGIGMIFPIIKELIKIKGKIREALLASLCIQTATLPIILYSFYEYPLYGIFLNLLVIPLMSLLVIGGLIGACASLLSLHLGKVLLFPCRLILTLYENACIIMEKLPGSRWRPGSPEKIRIIMYYFLLSLGLFIIWKHTSAKKERKKHKLYPIIIGSYVCFLSLILTWKLDNGIMITMLDVGQGDCIIVKSETGKVYLIDGGSTSVSKVGIYRILPYLKYMGIKEIDYILISHVDQDHISGILELMNEEIKEIKINNLLMPSYTNSDNAYKEVIRMAKKRGISVMAMGRGDVLTDEKMVITCYHPYKKLETDDRNEASMVIGISFENFDCLFTGDIGEETEKRLAQTLKKKWDVLKVAHHGSGYSSCWEFLKKIEPAYALISCGEKNTYGHPHKETIKRIKDIGGRIFITKDIGAIFIWTNGEKMTVKEFL